MAVVVSKAYRVGNGRMGKMLLAQGDLTKWSGDAIVNAANERMLGGGGVDGAIHRRAGKKLLEACKAIPEVRAGVRCRTGEARMTPGFELSAKAVIHTVGPIYSTPTVSAPLLRRCYTACLALANEKKMRSIAFPAISCGVYGYPLDEAAELAVSTCADADVAGGVEEIVFVLFGKDTFSAWERAADRLLERV